MLKPCCRACNNSISRCPKCCYKMYTVRQKMVDAKLNPVIISIKYKFLREIRLYRICFIYVLLISKCTI